MEHKRFFNTESHCNGKSSFSSYQTWTSRNFINVSEITGISQDPIININVTSFTSQRTNRTTPTAVVKGAHANNVEVSLVE